MYRLLYVGFTPGQRMRIAFDGRNASFIATSDFE